MQHDPITSLIPVVDGIPGPLGLLSVLLFVAFVAHLLFMNAVVGMALITLAGKVRALAAGIGAGNAAAGGTTSPAPGPVRAFFRRNADAAEAPYPDYAQDTLLPKGLGLVVNLGIPPLLFIQCIYSQYIYVSSILMAQWWLAVMPVVMLGYYGLYLNMAREGLSETARTVALGIGVCLLLFNAFLFVNNITLLEDPSRWSIYAEGAGGSFLNLGDPQVLPRYLHFMTASVAVGGLCLAVYAEYTVRNALRLHDSTSAARQERRKKEALAWFVWASLLQIPFGIWFLLSQPSAQRALFLGQSPLASALFVFALIFLCAALYQGWRQKAYAAAALTLPVVLGMAGMRSLLRESMLAPYYAPQMRDFETGPFLFFIACLIASAAVLWYLGKVYLRPPTVRPASHPGGRVPVDGDEAAVAAAATPELATASTPGTGSNDEPDTMPEQTAGRAQGPSARIADGNGQGRAGGDEQGQTEARAQGRTAARAEARTQGQAGAPAREQSESNQTVKGSGRRS